MNQQNKIERPDDKWFDLVSRLSKENVASGKGGPFAAAVIRNGALVASACNSVLDSGDPTAHAEVSVIRKACQVLGSFQLENCILISSCEPCPMCLGAIYWARPSAVFYVNSREDAAEIGFDDQFIYDEIGKEPQFRQIPFLKTDYPEAREAFREWKNKTDKTPY
jgi:tRNA(Arg) A34 adenosine deaminase TadA